LAGIIGSIDNSDNDFMNPLQLFRAVCFDLDGTLVDSYAAIAASVNHVRAQHGLAPLSVTEVKQFVGRGPEYLLQHTVPGCHYESDYASYREHHPTVMIEKTFLLPGAVEALQTLHNQGRRLGLCSNKPRLFSQELLRHLQIDPWLTAVVGPEDVPRLKPAPDMLVLAMTRLGVSREQTLYIGDMAVDIQTARAAGVTVWVVPTGCEEATALQAAKPDRLLRDLHELAELAAP
jgi:2-phosphoglycolate phosphatase